MYINPYVNNDSNGHWLRANFHAHAGTGAGTCGSYEINDVIALYKEAGYDVLTISNHDRYSDTQDYQSKYDMILFNGFEYSHGRDMLCIDVKNAIRGTNQEVAYECKNQGGFSILCHPHWQKFDYWPLEEIDSLSCYCGIEIYNPLIFRLSGTGIAVDVWDYVLSKGKLVWGFGNDDFHRWYDLRRVWNMIYSSENNREDVKKSILNGNFYVSTGLILDEFNFDGSTIKIRASGKDTYIRSYVYNFIGKNGNILSTIEGETGIYELTGEELYIRVQVASEHGAMLWTQPVYKEGLFSKP